ncbi:PROTEIN MXL-2 [Ceraceosorus bombacis]|uniref:PROTEIN MXL-2 n=1 Tax=Ceraceosorus bombacis TaxID=401625 RepID=A0A0P1BSM2_9BASI|nr:PROTEIN MXL-2 [Ceraceosorus bombacis]
MILPNVIRQTGERTASHHVQRVSTDFPPRMDDHRRDSRHAMDVDREHRRENPQAVPFAPHQAHPARAASISGMSQPHQSQGMWDARRSSSESERISSRLPPARRNSRAAELPRALVDAAPGTRVSVPRRPSDGESRHAAYPGPPPADGQRTLAYHPQERFAPRSPPTRSEMAPPSRASGSPSTAQLPRLRTVSGDGSSLSASGLPASAATGPREAAWAYHRKLSAPGDIRQPFPPRRSVDDVDAAQRTAQRARTQHVEASPAGADSKRHILPPLPPDLIAGNAATTTRSTLPPLRPPPGFHAHSYHVSEPHALAERAVHRLPSGTSASLNMHEQSFPSYTYDHEMEDVYGDDVRQRTLSASAESSRPNLQHIVDVRRRGGTSAQQTRRMNHLISEQRRRESINAGFEELRKVLPNCREGGESKATILRRAIDHIGNLHELVHRQQLAHREQITRGEGPGSRSRSPSDPPRGPGRHERVGSQPSNASGSQASMSNAGPSANVLSIHTNMHSGPIQPNDEHEQHG